MCCATVRTLHAHAETDAEANQSPSRSNIKQLPDQMYSSIGPIHLNQSHLSDNLYCQWNHC